MAAVWRSRCIFSSILCGKNNRILNSSTDFSRRNFGESKLNLFQRNYSSYKASPFVEKIKEQYEFVVVKNPPEWKFVERLLPLDTIPHVTPKETYPSGWIPPTEEAKLLPFYISRTKNHQLPIYLLLKSRGAQKISKIKRIEGDIWQMNDEVKQYLREKNSVYVETRVHELARHIDVKGDHVNHLINWAHSKGF